MWSTFSKRIHCLMMAALVVVWVFATTGVYAQTGTTSLHGLVTDKSGASIGAAKVTLENVQQGFHREMNTTPAGEYEFAALQPGVYILTVEMAGFRRYEQRNVQLLVNLPSTVNVVMEVGSATQTVEVLAQAEKLNTTDASLGIAFDENQIKQLPLEAGNIPELLSLQAGVAYTGSRPDMMTPTAKTHDTRNGAVNGAHSDQSNITLDGTDVNKDTKGFAFESVLPITQDSVQEFRVTTTNYNADEGRSSGAQVVLVTKSGTNNFHGSLFELHRNTATSANDYFIKLAQLQAGAPNQAPKLIRNIFGGSLGGPILKDRLFFFVNFQGGRQREAQSVVRVVPSAALQDGVIQYQCQTLADGSLDTATCPGMTVQGLTGSHTVQPGYFGLNPTQIKNMDPQGIGVSTNVMIPYFHTFAPFAANDNSVGDGVNFVGYRFSGPVAINTNWYIARADYKLTSNGNHSLFWRGALRNDTNAGVPYLPGEGPELTQVDYSKGYTVGYTAVLRPSLVNNFRYGYTRESYGAIGNQTQDVIFFRALNNFNDTPGDSSLAYTNTLNYQVPVHNFVDDISWVRGSHTFQFGGNISLLRNPQSNNTNSFSSASDNPSWLDTASMANSGAAGHFDPGFEGYPAVDSNFGNNYDYPMGALIGMVTQVNAQYNFTHSGAALPDRAPVVRRFAADTWEMYAQDSWKAKSNLTLTFGLRYMLSSPPWETNGLQVTPNVSLSDWFNQRGADMRQGLPASAVPRLSFNLGGPANGGGPGLYDWDKKDFGPHLAVAWSPDARDGLLKTLLGGPGKTTIRAGAGIVYDRLGPALLATFDRSGSFGLSTTLTNTGGVETPGTAPRVTGLTGIQNIPTTDLTGATIFAPPPAGSFPQTFPSGLNGAVGSYAVYFGMDNKLKTPYSETFDFSIGRDLGHDFTLEVSYVGRLSHRLLSQEDPAAPLDLVDPKTGIDYFTAVRALANIYRTGVKSDQVTDAMIGSTVSYWQDLMGNTAFLPGANGAPQGFRISRCATAPFASKDPVIAAYDLFCGFKFNETTGLQGIDQGFGFRDFSNFDSNGNRIPYYPVTGPYTFVDPQFAALYTWRSVSNAAYNGLQVNLRRHMNHGLQFDFNYTYSKSIDLSSDAYRINDEGGLGGQIINPWNPKAGLRAVSDFDLTHQVNANWIWELPFGKGRWIANGAGKGVDAVIGGWQLSGLARWTSGFPVGVGNGAQWPTNWELSGFGTQIAHVHTTGATKNPDGTVNIFGTAADAANVINNDFRPDFPGEVGNRNTLRGDGFAGVDLGLSKRWIMPYSEHHSVQFRWEVFNALNLTRFDVQSLSLSLTNGSNFGNYTGLLTNPRVMQFALRYEF
jgi:hypothetical protein